MKTYENSYLVISTEILNLTYTWDETLRPMHINTDELLNIQDFMIPGEEGQKDTKKYKVIFFYN